MEKNQKQKLIVWFVFNDKLQYKKFGYNQFWVDAKNNDDALNIFKQESKKQNLELKTMGLSNFSSIENSRPDLFKDKTFH